MWKLDRTGQPVQLLGVIPRADQIQVLRCAAAVVQPSLFEGWSTVIEDAKALGRPVIASDIAVHREQLEGYEAAHLFKAGDAADLATVLASRWPGLQAGPDTEGERQAAGLRDARRRDSALRFIEIVSEAGAMNHDAPITGRTS